MSPQLLMDIFFLLCAGGALSVLVAGERWTLLILGLVGSLASLAAGAAACLLLVRGGFAVKLWSLPSVGTVTLSPDRLSALFMLVSVFVFLPASIYSVGYLQHYRGHFDLRTLCVCYFGLFASVVLVLSAGDAISFLISWELMSLLAYLLVNYQRRREEDPRPGYLMLTLGEAGFLGVTLAFLILAAFSNGLSFAGLRTHLSSFGVGARWSVFLLSFLGFSVKAGLIPFNRWLPQAHPIAPANVSALLSGVLLNLGVYGIARVNLDLAPAASVGPGVVVLLAGTLSALAGILYANRGNDIKEVLANSSIENMGLICAGLGAAMVFMASGQPIIAGIALIAAAYQMTNHSVYKSLLFFGAGVIDTQAGTRQMDQLGGLIRRMPGVAFFFLVGALSISALPPLNGFVSEWLTLQSLLQSAVLSSRAVKMIFALCGAGLALTAGLVITCFVKFYAMTFLGVSRSKGAPPDVAPIHPSIRAAMGISAALCVLLGVLSSYFIPVLGQAVARLTGGNATSALVPPFFAPASSRSLLPAPFLADFHSLGAQLGHSFLPGPGLVVLHRGGEQNPVVFAMSTAFMALVLFLLLGISFALVRGLISRGRQTARRRVWAGGLPSLLPELTYTATGFSNPVRVTFNAIFHPRQSEDRREIVAIHFRARITRVVEEVHVLDRILFVPMAGRAQQIAQRFAGMHHGRLNAYAAYILGTLLVVLLVGQLPEVGQVTLGPAAIVILALLVDRLL
jgi:hydrogenase-4 component B